MKRALIILFVLVSGFAFTSHAAKAVIQGKIERTLTSDGATYGGCMIFLDQVLANYALNCTGRWVTFSCTGDFAPKDAAYRMFDSAQLALALDKEVLVIVDDLKKHNGFCYAERIDILSEVQ